MSGLRTLEKTGRQILLQKEHSSANILTVAQENQFQTATSRIVINLCCFKALSSWSFGIAAAEKRRKPLGASSLSSLFSRPWLTRKVRAWAGHRAVQALAEGGSINTGLYCPGAKGHCTFLRPEPDVTETEPGASESQLPRTPRAWRRSRSYDLSNKHSLRFPPLLRTKRCHPKQIHRGKTRPSAGI